MKGPKKYKMTKLATAPKDTFRSQDIGNRHYHFHNNDKLIMAQSSILMRL